MKHPVYGVKSNLTLECFSASAADAAYPASPPVFLRVSASLRVISMVFFAFGVDLARVAGPTFACNSIADECSSESASASGCFRVGRDEVGARLSRARHGF